ncbi:MAG: HAMP domain-containing protein [Chloroflexi bacterium]|nr:HAMP domain-containing protein [Chloroflexota bacterium]
MLSSLRARLVFSHLSVIVLAMGVAGLLLLSFLEAYFLRSTEDSLIAQAHLTVQAIVPSARAAAPDIVTQAPLNNAIQQQTANNLALQTSNLSVPTNTLVLNTLDLSYLSNASLQLGAQLTTRIRIINAQGIVLVDNENREVGADVKSDPLIAQALRGEFSSHIDTGGEANLAVAVPIVIDDQNIGVAYLSQSLRDVLTVLQDLRVRLALSTFIALVLAAVVGWWLSRAITRPVQQLTSAAEAIATGQFDQSVTVNSRDELGRLSGTFNDMTTRLNAARQMQVDFVANVSHELRTPLTSIKGTVETLRAGAVDDLTVRDHFLETIETETDRLTRLVNDLLLLSRADSAALNLRRQALDVGRLGRALIDRLAAQAATRDLVCKIEVDPTTPLAWADADRVEQVLLNLLDNALKYARPQTTITIEIAPTPDRWVLARVRDHGAGIPATELARIGQRFYRADKARSREQGGHGLGLAIAQSLIHAHGGKLWLESEEGVGTSANFTLPTKP